MKSQMKKRVSTRKVQDIEDLGKPEEPEDPMMADPTDEEPYLAAVKALARDGLKVVGHHGEMGSMGVPLTELPRKS